MIQYAPLEYSWREVVISMTSNIVLSTKKYNVVGTRPIRHDGYDKVTGKALYSADMNLPSMLFGKVL